MSDDSQKKYFELAYKTGTDIWTRPPSFEQGRGLTEKLGRDALILDLGSGRGLFAKHLADQGFRVIGLDFDRGMVDRGNSLVKDWGHEGRLKFMEGNALDIPLADASFDGACDFGLLESLYRENWATYASEVCRILKPDGYYFNTSLSRETKNFFDFQPKASPDGEFEKYGMHYHFFTKEEMKSIFINRLEIISEEIIFDKGRREVALLETLWRKSAPERDKS